MSLYICISVAIIHDIAAKSIQHGVALGVAHKVCTTWGGSRSQSLYHMGWESLTKSVPHGVGVAHKVCTTWGGSRSQSLYHMGWESLTKSVPHGVGVAPRKSNLFLVTHVKYDCVLVACHCVCPHLHVYIGVVSLYQIQYLAFLNSHSILLFNSGTYI